MIKSTLSEQTLSEQTLSEQTLSEQTLSEQTLSDYILSETAIVKGNMENFIHADRNSEIDFRKSCRPKVIKKAVTKREREPSRISVKKVYKVLKNTGVRKKFKCYIRNNVPRSSVIVQLLSLKVCALALNRKQNACWTTKKNCLACKGRRKSCNLRRRKRILVSKKKNCNEKYCISGRILLLSGDVELNPGPVLQPVFGNDLSSSENLSMNLLRARLNELGLIPFDVGGGGDCFFRAVSHQIFGSALHHLAVRRAGVQYMRIHPEQFIEYVIEQSWVDYLFAMSRLGTWCDAAIVQAVAECYNLRINIVESGINFHPSTIINPQRAEGVPRRICIGHLDEFHYVSTIHNESVDVTEGQDFSDNSNIGADNSFDYVCGSEDVGGESRESSGKRRIDVESDGRSQREKKFKKVVVNYKEAELDSVDGNVDLDCVNNRSSTKKCSGKRKEYFRQYRQRKRKINSERKSKEQTCKGKRKRNKNSIVVKSFHNDIKFGPEYICTCCDQLWYKSSVLRCNCNKYVNCSVDIVKLCITGVKSVSKCEWICKTCDSYLKWGRMPCCAKANKMLFPEKPEILNLTSLEERLVAPRIPFMQIRELPRGGQLSIHGNVVNVPADVTATVNCLPKLLSESDTIAVRLKRRLSYKHCYQFQNVRPKVVLKAAKYLVSSSELFQSEGIEIRDSWESELEADNGTSLSEFLAEGNDGSGDIDRSTVDEALISDCIYKDITSENVDDDDDDKWCEVEERPTGVMDTLLESPDCCGAVDRILNFAPGEGNRPLGIFVDKDAEYLSFPTIFCGKRRAENKERVVPVYYSTICKWELRSRDRRVAQSVPNIFYKLKKLQIKQILDTSCLSLRKYKTKGKRYTAGDFKSESNVKNIIHNNEGFRVLRNLRGSPPYFEKCKKDLFAMIRQLGNPTWFCSFSAAETRWVHLLKILGRLVENKEYSDSEIASMNWQKKSELIQKDPVTCARNFDHMVQLFFKDVLKSKAMPVGEIEEFFYRVEFQQRGSPHIHALLWVKKAPQYGVNSDNDVIKFVDNYLTCKNDTTGGMSELVNLQMHRHAKTCKRKGQNICRFNFPLPPMPKTMILQPLDVKIVDEISLQKIKDTSEKLKKLLDEMKYGEDVSFADFLQKLEVTEEEYILAVRFSLKRPMLLLKRSTSEIRINNYNSVLLEAWQANMDIQYVLDPYACAVYILSYITKGQRGMSKLLERASEEVKLGNEDIRKQVRHIGNKFLNAVEVSAQEAVYLVLQMPLRRASRDFQFINTSSPEERVVLLKTMDKINDLPDNSENIESDSLIKRYQRRPRKLEKLCLADFAAWYNCVKNKEGDVQIDGSSTEVDMLEEFLCETNCDENLDDDVTSDSNVVLCEEYLMNGNMKLVRRKKSKIIRTVRFNKNKDSENYFREQLMLYVPWRNEEKDLIGNCSSYQESFFNCQHVVQNIKQKYEMHTDLIDKALEDIESSNVPEHEADYGNVAPNAQHNDEQDVLVGTNDSELLACFEPGNDKLHSQYDLLDESGIFPRTNDDTDVVIKRLNDINYRQIVRLLNKEQMEFFYHVLHCAKISDEPVNLFLSGGAGVGKSTVTNALYEALTRYFNRVPGENPDHISVLKLAPTGKAAFNINGNTIHSGLKVPANRGFDYCPLDVDRLNRVRVQLGKLKLLLIDEVSMVGSGMFNFINLRLQQIMGTQAVFGGVSMIVVGDLFQLKPVFDKWIFDNSLQSYGLLATNIWQEYFVMYELTEIMRQKEDKAFAELLNRLREGNHSEMDLKVLKSRILKEKRNDGNYPMTTTHILPTNEAVNFHNDYSFCNSKRDKVQVKAIDIIVGDMCKELKEKMKEKIPHDASKTMGLSSIVSIAVGGKYDLATNVSVLDGMTNGAECVVESIDYRIEKSSRPSIIWVSFSDPDVGRKCCRDNLHLYNNNVNKDWTPVLEVMKQFKIAKRSQGEVIRRQFPLRQASAKTIHRCQGDTLNEIVVDFPASKKEHMHYVGLSRVKNLSGLKIINLNEKKIKVCDKVVEEMKRLRSKAVLNPAICFLYKSVNSNLFKIVFHNVRSLRLHFEDVKADYSMQVADINVFVETGLCSVDNDECYFLNGFNLYRNDFSVESCTHSVYGSAMYVKTGLQCISTPYRCNHNDVEITVTVLDEPVKNLHIVGIYRSKSKVTISKFIESLDYLYKSVIGDAETPVVILGDFNVNFKESSKELKCLLRSMCEEKGYVQIINEYTTDYRTQIDHIYTNVERFISHAGVLESYFSDHKPIFVTFNL